MAILFELVVNFGADDRGAEAAVEEVRRVGRVDVRSASLPLSDPGVTRLGAPDTYFELSVYVRGMGYGAPGPRPTLDPGSLTREEITQVGREKESAIDAQDFENAAVLRDREQQLLGDKAARMQEWAALPSLSDEVERLRELLRRHGIDPQNGAA